MSREDLKLIVTVLAATQACADAFGADAPTVRAWVEKEIATVGVERLNNVFIEWQLVDSPSGNRAMRGWWLDRETWRINLDAHGKGLKDKYWIDTGASGGVLWRLKATELDLETFAGRPPERAWDIDAGMLTNALAGSRWGGLLALAGLKVDDVRAEGPPGTWVVSGGDDKRVISVTIQWKDDEALGLAVQSTVTFKGGVQGQGSDDTYTWRSSDWRKVDLGSGPVWCTFKVETALAPAGHARGATVVKSLRSAPPDEVKTACAPPEVGTPDPVRGEVRIVSVNDYRPEVARATVQTPQGVVERPLRVSASERYGWLRPVGWACFALCVGVVLWGRFKARAT